MAPLPSVPTLPPQEQSIQPLIEIIYCFIEYFLWIYITFSKHLYKLNRGIDRPVSGYLIICGRCFLALLNKWKLSLTSPVATGTARPRNLYMIPRPKLEPQVDI